MHWARCHVCASITLPTTPFARFQLILLVLAQVGVVTAAAATFGAPPVERAAALLAGVGLGIYWIVGYSRGRFTLALEPVEAFAVLVLLETASGDPLLAAARARVPQLIRRLRARARPLRGLDGACCSSRTAISATSSSTADLSRAMGTALVPFIVPALRAAFDARRSCSAG